MSLYTWELNGRIWQLQAFLTVSMIPADLYPDTTIEQYFLLPGVYGEFGAKIMEIKVAKI